MSKDLYSILEVDRNSTPDEIKKSYRRLSKKFHPDVNKDSGAESKFKEISSAYDVLSDSQKKSNYDRFGDPNGGGNPFGGGGNPFSGGGENPFGDIFNNFGDFFGGGNPHGNSGRTRGGDLRMKVVVDIKDILNSSTKKIKYKRQTNCTGCNGKGGTDVRTCLSCNGQGQRIVVQNTPFGQMRTQVSCPDCGGTGQQIKNKCGLCHGEGTKLSEEVVDVQIPAGVSSGMQLKMQSYGNHIRNGEPGDLFIIIEEKQDFSYRRDNNNIIIEKNISVIDALCGSNIEVDTPRGKMNIHVEAGTEPGKMNRVVGKGIPDINFGLGDLYIKLNIKIPKNIPIEEKLILEKLKSSNTFRV